MQLLDTRLIGDVAVQGVAKCPFCGDEKTFLLALDDYLLWRNGQAIQIAFPDLSDDDHERLISGIDPVCWAKMLVGVA